MPADARQVRDHRGRPGSDGGSHDVRRRRRRYAITELVRSCAVSVAIGCAYFGLPFTTSFKHGASLILLAGLAVVTALLVWQLRGVLRSPYPRVRTIASLITALPLFLMVFAATYFVASRSEPHAWSEPLSRFDALYFAVTVFSTVGFGDIVPVTELTRAMAMAQMVGDVVVIGIVVRVMIAAMREAIARQNAQS